MFIYVLVKSLEGVWGILGGDDRKCIIEFAVFLSDADRPAKTVERVVGGYMALVPKSADSVAD